MALDTRLHELVRVVRLRQPPEDYDGWRLNRRPPAVGDVGTLIDVLTAPGFPSKYVVECSSSEEGGTSTWLADFFEDELTLVTP